MYTSRTTEGRPFKPKKLSVPFLYPGVPPFRGLVPLGRRNLVPILPPAHPLGGGQCFWWRQRLITFTVVKRQIGPFVSVIWYGPEIFVALRHIIRSTASVIKKYRYRYLEQMNPIAFPSYIVLLTFNRTWKLAWWTQVIYYRIRSVTVIVMKPSSLHSMILYQAILQLKLVSVWI